MVARNSRVVLALTVLPLFTMYRNSEYKVIRKDEYRMLIEDDRGNRMWTYKDNYKEKL